MRPMPHRSIFGAASVTASAVSRQGSIIVWPNGVSCIHAAFPTHWTNWITDACQAYSDYRLTYFPRDRVHGSGEEGHVTNQSHHRTHGCGSRAQRHDNFGTIADSGTWRARRTNPTARSSGTARPRAAGSATDTAARPAARRLCDRDRVGRNHRTRKVL